MSIFERDKLPLVANVEQVPFLLFASAVVRIVYYIYFLELFDWPDHSRKDSKRVGRGDGAASRQPGGHASYSFNLAPCHIPEFLRSNPNKVRIVALYIQFREGVPDEDRRRLYQHARLSLSEQDAINALVHLGVRISRVGVFAFVCCRDFLFAA
jgi:hypothetical protein